MDISIVLADAAQTTPDGKAQIIGAGWAIQHGPMPMSVVVFIDVDWDETNIRRAWQLELVDGDGARVKVEEPTGTEHEVVIDGGFEPGRPPGLTQGAPITLAPLTITIGPLALAPGRYEWRLTVSGRTPDVPPTVVHRTFTRADHPGGSHSGPPGVPQPGPPGS